MELGSLGLPSFIPRAVAASLSRSDPKAAIGSQLEAPFPNRPQPARGANQTAKAEEMNACDRRTTPTRDVPDHRLRARFHEKARNGPGSRLEGADRISDPAKRRKSQQAPQARRPRKPDAHRQPVFFHLRGPHEDRLGLETELRHDLQIETCSPGKAFLGGQRCLERRSRDPGMAFGVARHAYMCDAMPLEQALAIRRAATCGTGRKPARFRRVASATVP